jgi:hypothetical protein
MSQSPRRGRGDRCGGRAEVLGSIRWCPTRHSTAKTRSGAIRYLSRDRSEGEHQACFCVNRGDTEQNQRPAGAAAVGIQGLPDPARAKEFAVG